MLNDISTAAVVQGTYARLRPVLPTAAASQHGGCKVSLCVNIVPECLVANTLEAVCTSKGTYCILHILLHSCNRQKSDRRCVSTTAYMHVSRSTT